MIGTTEERLREIDRMYPVWEEDTLWTRFEKNAARFGERPFVLFQGKTYSYRESLREVKRLARGFYSFGIRKGDHVAVLLYNSPEYVFLTFALSMLGAVKVPVNMKLSPVEKAFVIRQSDCGYAIGHSLKKLPEKSLVGLKGLILRHTEEMDAPVCPWTGWDAMLSVGEAVREKEIPVNHNALSLSDIMYTSGSTSFPKGVMLTQDMMLRSSFGTCRSRRMEVGRRILVPIPLYHIFGYNEGMLAAMWVGGSIVLCDRKAEGSYILELLRTSQANDIISVPLIIMRILEALGDTTANLPDMHAGYWASTCPDWIWDRAKEAFGITDVTTGYGMTECGSTTTLFSPGCESRDLMRYQGYLKDCGCAGAEMENHRLLEIQIRDPETGEVLPTGTLGELFCRGLTVTNGYYKNSEANEASFHEGGWFATGDMGILEADGKFSFQGRKDFQYKINGENVSPQRLNTIIGSSRTVRAVETVGIESERYGARGVAFVELERDNDKNRKKLEKEMQKSMADFEIPRYIVVSSGGSWPRTSCGKINPHALKQLAEQKVRNYEKNCAGAQGKEIKWIS